MPNSVARTTIIFDLDGLILDSLPGLSDAMLEVVGDLSLSEQDFCYFQDFDLANPGVSRFEKFELATNLANIDDNSKLPLRAQMARRFDEVSLRARLASDIDESIFEFRSLDSDRFDFYLVTNCDNNQLETVVKEHHLEKLFGRNFFGTPPSKRTIVEGLRRGSAGTTAFLSVSDSESDFQIAKELQLDFALVTRFARDLNFNSEFPGEKFITLSQLHESLLE